MLEVNVLYKLSTFAIHAICGNLLLRPDTDRGRGPQFSHSFAMVIGSHARQGQHELRHPS